LDPSALWYGRHPLSTAMLPLSWLYCAIVRIRRFAYRHGLLKSHRLPVPVVVVGNLTVGGTGKTPLVVALAEEALARGFRPAILTRGYGGRSRSWPVAVSPDADPALVGDEPAMLARRRLCPVVAGPDRVASGKLAVRQFDADLLLTDDGLQHYRLARDLEIATLDGERGLGNGRCLPAGPLREPASRLGSVDFAVRKRSPGDGRPGLGFRLVPGELKSLRDPSRRQPLESLSGRRVTGVAGIGNPAPFFAMLRSAGLWVDERVYPDHHVYTAGEAARWPLGPVVMTEKDAVKCATFAGTDHWLCPATAVPDAALIDSLFARLGAPSGHSCAAASTSVSMES
jgi:tetraacyldisaccharide 4'-kinase